MIIEKKIIMNEFVTKMQNEKLLIIDNDYIYKEKDADYFNQSTLTKTLEEKYLKEKHDTIF